LTQDVCHPGFYRLIRRAGNRSIRLFTFLPMEFQGVKLAGSYGRNWREPWADTDTSTGRLMLAVLGGLADVERDLIRTRTAEGRSRAKAQGKHMGRPPSLTPAQQKEATRRRVQGATLQELADSYDRSISTMRRNTQGVQGK
jgi:Resolvase, N terminal domain